MISDDQYLDLTEEASEAESDFGFELDSSMLMDDSMMPTLELDF